MSTTDHSPATTARYPFNSTVGLRLSDEYDRVRKQNGLVLVRLAYGEPAWLVTRADDARQVLGDRRFSRSDAVNHDEPRASEGRPGRGLIEMDPPRHTRVRAVVARAFTVRQVERMRPQIRARVAKLLDAVEATGHGADLVSQLAVPLPMSVLCQLLGAPETDFPRLRAWAEALMMTNTLPAAAFDTHYEEFRAYIRELMDRHRAAPRDDLMTALIEAETSDDPLFDTEVEQLCLCLLLAGSVAPATQIANFVYTLLNHPAQLALLRADPTLVPQAVEELLRFVQLRLGSLHPRYATTDVEVGGTLVRAGTPVLVDLGGANHDPTRYEDPDTLDITREDITHVAFGHGFHHCVGAPLGRVECQEVLRALFTRFPGLHVSGDITWMTEATLWGPRVLPVGW
ncbi:cytochrome P450 [Streptomyces sp. NPDC090303]|uniref:cytochrome P450 n=1 Tax=Streptomyces sp. NPDC090303 TaxID=3365960 RepID=UPI003827B2E5